MTCFVQLAVHKVRKKKKNAANPQSGSLIDLDLMILDLMIKKINTIDARCCKKYLLFYVCLWSQYKVNLCNI